MIPNPFWVVEDLPESDVSNLAPLPEECTYTPFFMISGALSVMTADTLTLLMSYTNLLLEVWSPD